MRCRCCNTRVATCVVAVATLWLQHALSLLQHYDCNMRCRCCNTRVATCVVAVATLGLQHALSLLQHYGCNMRCRCCNTRVATSVGHCGNTRVKTVLSLMQHEFCCYRWRSWSVAACVVAAATRALQHRSTQLQHKRCNVGCCWYSSNIATSFVVVATRSL